MASRSAARCAGPVSTCLVSGAGGFVGRALCNRLRERGHTLRGMGRRRPADWQPTDWQVADLGAADWPAPPLAGVDVVFHLAGIAHTEEPDAGLVDRVNHQASLRLAQLARDQGVRRFVFISSVLAERPGHSAYARAKLAAEQGLAQLAASGEMQLQVLRPALVYGPGAGGNLARLMRSIAAGRLPPFAPGLGPRPMVSREDLVAAICCAAFDAPPLAAPLALCDGEHYCLRRIAQALAAARGQAYPRWYLPGPLWRAVALAAGPLRLLPGLAGLPSGAQLRRLFDGLPLPPPPPPHFPWRPGLQLEQVAPQMWAGAQGLAEPASG